jgi:DNA-binding NtrC family response regulator
MSPPQLPAPAYVPSVLLVDDTPANQRVLGRVFGAEGFVVHAAESGEAALAALDRANPDLVVLDLHMPGLDGIQVLEQAKAVDPHLPVVMVTAYGDLPSAVQAIRLGAYDYLTKPFDNDEILFTVGRALEKKALEREQLRSAKLTTILEMTLAMHHEINNPLALILANAEMLQRELQAMGSNVMTKLTRIIEGAQRIASVVRDLQRIHTPVTSPVTGVGKMLDLHRSVAEEGGP